MKRKHTLLLLLSSVVVLLVAALLIVEEKEPIETAVMVKKEVTEGVTETATGTGKIIKGTIYLVIDDVGYNMEELDRFLELPVPVTFSILPFLPFTAESSEAIRKAGNEYIIHIPMEPLNGEDPGPGALYASMTNVQIDAALTAILHELPGAVGANNHMGSKFTSTREGMHTVLMQLRESNIFFLDSYTAAESVVREVTETLDMPYVKRDVFLDNTDETDAIKEGFARGIRTAESAGTSVLIGHVWSEHLPDIISELYETIEQRNLTFGYISELFEREER